MDYALTLYPLSRDFRERLEQSAGRTPTYLHLADLRKGSPLEGLSRLRAVRGRLTLPVEDEDGRFALPLLKAVAGIASAHTIEILHPDLRRERVSRLHIAGLLARLLLASAQAQRDTWKCRTEAAKLVATPRIDFPSGRARSLLYLNANLWFGVKAGGSVGHIAGVVNGLQQSGYDVSFASAGSRMMIHADVKAVSLAPPPVFGLPYELNYYRFQRLTVAQLLNLSKPQFSFLYQRMSVANYAGVLLSRRWGIPLVFEYNGSEVWVARHWGRPLRCDSLAATIEDLCLRHAHLIVTVSDVLRDELLERGIPSERIVMYPNCIDPTVFDPARFSPAENHALRKTLDLTEDTIVATFIGTFGQWHGVDVLARAIRLLVDEDAEWLRRTRLHFILIGDGLKMTSVRDTLAGDLYAPFFTLTALVPQNRAPSYLNISDLLLSPHIRNADGSRFFGSPTKLFEYMAMGKAIVASDLDQIGEVLRNSVRLDALPAAVPTENETRLAVLVEPGDPSALARAIKFLVDSPEWRRVLGRNARSEALSKYTWRHHVDAILRGLEVLEPAGGPMTAAVP